MSVEKTYVMLKPGVMQRRLVGEIVNRFERKGLRIIGAKLFRITEEQAKNHYSEHAEKNFFSDLVSYIVSDPVFAFVLEGDGAVTVVRRMVGATRVEESLPGTIRGDYSLHTQLNVIHASDSVESAEREIGIFFRPEELVRWSDGNDCWC